MGALNYSNIVRLLLFFIYIYTFVFERFVIIYNHLCTYYVYGDCQNVVVLDMFIWIWYRGNGFYTETDYNIVINI